MMQARTATYLKTKTSTKQNDCPVLSTINVQIQRN